MILWYVACLGFTIALIDSIRLYYRSKKCNCSTVGNIIKIKETLSFAKSGPYLDYQPVYRYMVLGKEYINKVPMRSANRQRYKLNSEVVLFYEKGNPRNFIPHDEIQYIRRSIIINFFLLILLLAPAVREIFKLY